VVISSVNWTISFVTVAVINVTTLNMSLEPIPVVKIVVVSSEESVVKNVTYS